MPRYDLIVRHAELVTAAGIVEADLGVSDGRIAALEPELSGTSRSEIDARGLHAFPGVIDAHVHFNEPGRVEWEGFASGTRALAAGGGTLACDMPLNAHPPTVDARSFRMKHAAARAAAFVDFALWGGLVPGNADRLEELAACGVLGVKAFMSTSGTADFPRVDDDTLYRGMARAAELGLMVAVHAESEAVIVERTREVVAAGRTGAEGYLATRPLEAETEAISRAIAIAKETQCRLHVVHVSSGRGVALIAEARRRGVDVSGETCPHYLTFTADDLARLGAQLKCAPPLRGPADREALWEALADGRLSLVTSDHSPAPPARKEGGDMLAVWGGISGCQSTLQVLLTEGYERRRVPVTLIGRITAELVARRFHLAGKGAIAVGMDADLVLVDLDSRSVLQPADLFYRHRQSPYCGRSWRGRVRRTLVRGMTVYRDGRFVAPPRGHLVVPQPMPRPLSPAGNRAQAMRTGYEL